MSRSGSTESQRRSRGAASLPRGPQFAKSVMSPSVLLLLAVVSGSANGAHQTDPRGNDNVRTSLPDGDGDQTNSPDSDTHTDADREPIEATPTSSSALDPTASTKTRWRVQLSLVGLLARPFTGGHSLGDWGYGAAFVIGASYAPIPISLGGDFGGVYWGSLTMPVWVQLGDQQVEVSETRTEQTGLVNLWARAQFPWGPVRPYVEVVGGLKMIDTKYSLAFPTGQWTTSTFVHRGTASSVGFGLGVDVLLVRAPASSDAELFATLGVRRLGGSHTSFQNTAGASFEVPSDTTVIMLGILGRWTPSNSASARDKK